MLSLMMMMMMILHNYFHLGCLYEKSNQYSNELYRKVPKFPDTRNKIQTKRPNLKVFHLNDANGIANSEDPDQTAPRGSGSSLFAQTYLS